MVERIIDPVSGDWTLSRFDIECIVIGAGLLGCGGGGSPALARLRCLQTLKDSRVIRVVKPER